MNKNYKRIICISLSLVLLLVSFLCFGALAADESLSPSIIKKNVAYGDRVQFLFATDVAVADSDGLKLVYYVNENGEYTAKNGQLLAADSEYNYAVDGVTYATFLTDGVSPSKTTEIVYAAAYVGETVPAKEDCLSYSLAEYFFDRLYKDDVISREDTDSQKALYTEYLGYADAAINHFNADATALSDCGYVVVKDGSHNLSSNFVIGSAEATLTYSGITTQKGYYHFESGLGSWSVKTYSLDGTIATSELAKGTALTVDGIKVVSPVMAEGGELPDGVTWTKGGTNAVSSATVAYYDETRGNVVKFENIVDNSAVSTSTKSRLRFLAGESFTDDDTVVFSTEYKIDDLSADYAEGVTSDTGAASTKYVGAANYRIQFVNSSGGIVCQVQYSIDKYGEARIYQVASGGEPSNGLSLPGGTYAVGNWVDLTLKVYDKTVDGATTTYIDVIATGLKKNRTETQTSTTTYDLGTDCDLSAIAGVQYYRYDSGALDSTLYFNNVSITKEATE